MSAARYDLAELHAAGTPGLLPARVSGIPLAYPLARGGAAVALPRPAVANSTADDPKERLAVDPDKGSNQAPVRIAGCRIAEP